MKIDSFGDENKEVRREDAKIIAIDVSQKQLDELGVEFTAAGVRPGDSIYDVQRL